MSRLLEDLACGAAGYLVGTSINSKRNPLNENINLPLDLYIEEYAKAHGVFTRSNSFARELLRIAENYKDSEIYDN